MKKNINSGALPQRVSAVISTLPDSSGVYLMKDAAGKIIYVGKALNLKNRVSTYFHAVKNLPVKTARLVSYVEDIEIIVTTNELEALILEASLIKKYHPRFNIDLKDDKKYPFIEVTTCENLPRICFSRKRASKKNRMFGPYPSSDFVRKIISLVRRYFRIRTCKDKIPKRIRPCLNYQLGKCSAPCCAMISQSDYHDAVRNAILFLEGHFSDVISSLKDDMEKESQKLNFERCASILKDIRAVEKIAGEQKVFFEKATDRDYIALYSSGNDIVFQLLMIREGKLIDKRHYIFSSLSEDADPAKMRAFFLYYYDDSPFIPAEIYVSSAVDDKDVLCQWLSMKACRAVSIRESARGDNRRLLMMASENARYNLSVARAVDMRDEKEAVLQELMAVLALSSVPNRIETYDISNISGKMAVGSMVVFSRGRPDRANYRRFKIKFKDTPDDFAMMREVLLRRFSITKKQDEWKKNYPDLIVIDGGKGQLSSAVEILSGLGIEIPVIGLAKKYEEIFFPENPDPLLLAKTSPPLNLLRHGRDEAHRFAITYHRKLRSISLKKEFEK